MKLVQACLCAEKDRQNNLCDGGCAVKLVCASICAGKDRQINCGSPVKFV